MEHTPSLPNPRSPKTPPVPCTTGAGLLLRGLASSGARPRTGANRFGLDMREAAQALGPPVCPILDIHTHINGQRAAPIWWQAAQMLGIEQAYSQIRVQDCAMVRDVVRGAGGRIGFIGFPEFRNPDRRWAWTEGYVEHIHLFREQHGAPMIKLWNAPRMFELFEGDAGKDIIAFDAPWRVKQVELAQSLGMGIMVHIADPDTWFVSKYADSRKYLHKRDHYPPLRRMMDRFKGPWLAAHMGGSPEDLDFLDELLASHANLYLDTSATKWVVRELSRHPRSRVREFFHRWQGRILFGSDIVSVDEHLAPTISEPGAAKHPMADLADSPQGALDLYASRYLALRLMFETDYDGESPIADPDLLMADPSLPATYADGSPALHAPRLQGLGLDAGLLRALYRGAGEGVLAKCQPRGQGKPN